jgi:hypothetical protein
MDPTGPAKPPESGRPEQQGEHYRWVRPAEDRKRTDPRCGSRLVCSHDQVLIDQLAHAAALEAGAVAGMHDPDWQFTQPTQACHIVSYVCSGNLVDQHVVMNRIAAEQGSVVLVEERDTAWAVSGKMDDRESPISQIDHITVAQMAGNRHRSQAVARRIVPLVRNSFDQDVRRHFLQAPALRRDRDPAATPATAGRACSRECDQHSANSYAEPMWSRWA